MSALSYPSYQSGFYSPMRGGVAKYPSLWRGCIGAWSFGLGFDGLDGIRDHSLHRRHGLYNTTRPTRGVMAGRRSASFVTNSINFYEMDYIQPLNDLTVAAWFRPTATAAFMRIVDLKYDLGFWVGNTGSGGSSYGGGVLAGSPPYGAFVSGTVDAWNFIAVQRRGDQSITHLWNGSGQYGTASFTTSTSATTTAYRLRVGNSSPAEVKNGDNWGGQIEEVRLYNYALGMRELALLASRPGIAYELARGVGRGTPLPTVAELTINAFLAKSVSNIS